MPPVPPTLAPRVLCIDEHVVTLCLEDDRAAQRIATGLGTLGVVILAATILLLGSVALGTLAIGALVTLTLQITRRWGRRSTQLHLQAAEWGLDDEPSAPWPAPGAIRHEGAWLVLGDVRLAAHGETEETVTALTHYLREVAAAHHGAS